MNKTETIAVIRSLLSSSRYAYNVLSLNKEFRKETGVDIPLFGYKNINEFLRSLPDTVKLTGTYPNQQISIVLNNKSSHIVSLVNRQRRLKTNSCGSRKFNKRSVFGRRGFNVKEVQETPVFLEKSHNLKNEKKSTVFVEKKNGMKFKDGRFKSAINLSKKNDLRNEYSQSQKQEENGNGFINGSSECKNETVCGVTEDSWKSSKSVFLLHNELSPLKSFLCDGETIPSIDLKLHATVGGYTEVSPCHIFNPHKFYFHFRKFKKKFMHFNDKLKSFYTNENISASSAKVKPNQMYATLYKIFDEPRWHRVEVLKIISDSQVLVNFIDYGKTVEILKEDLKLLRRDFALLPRQAVLGSLANIKPLKGQKKWSVFAIHKFCNLVFRKDLIAGVVHVDPEVSCIWVALSLTEGSEIHINDTLVQEGCAEFEINFTHNSVDSVMERLNIHTEESMRNGKEENVLNSDSNCSSFTSPTPIFYSPHIHSNNKRLRNMFLTC